MNAARVTAPTITVVANPLAHTLILTTTRDRSDVAAQCSCGQSFGRFADRHAARIEHAEHFEKINRSSEARPY